MHRLSHSLNNYFVGRSTRCSYPTGLMNANWKNSLSYRSVGDPFLWLENDYLLERSFIRVWCSSMEIPRRIACLWNPLFGTLMGVFLYSLAPFPGALPSNLLVLLKPNGIEFLANLSFQLLPWQPRNVMVSHSIKLVHNLTISICFLRSSAFCLLYPGPFRKEGRGSLYTQVHPRTEASKLPPRIEIDTRLALNSSEPLQDPNWTETPPRHSYNG